MKKILALVSSAVALFVAPSLIRHYGIAYELKDVPPEKRGLVFDVTTIEMKYFFIDFLLIPLGFVLLLVALFLFVREIGKYSAT
jgi:hypothetical protein